ncbi:YfjL-like protein [Sutcliffiella rhizosphaerae]|uniref:YfjL-like N-terminal domain-containing protein n=1 Tax=Sutcliffiella rhizosphaerae TaxID=2880967 RepID=A0ABM8YMY2_9BACI|nr:hypothetical protein [Sutcliffiella rhizosphaerae]CAG9621312.1 hypothetical protein BACCIP111883_02084 [Sutcliffiella rhizosphaerae]
MKKRLLKIIIILIFGSIILSIYSLFNGIPFGSNIAKAKITNYVEQVYDFNESVPKPHYNFKDSSYDVSLPLLGSEFSYDLLNNKIFDERLSDDVYNQFQGDYEALRSSYNENIEIPQAFLFSTILANGEYSESITLHQKIYLLSFVNREKIAPEESMKMPAKLTKEIIDSLGESYNITSVQVIYKDLNGLYEISLDGKKAISIEMLENSTLKTDRFGEEDRELFLELNERYN